MTRNQLIVVAVAVSASIGGSYWATEVSTNASENSQRAQREVVHRIQVDARDATVAGCYRTLADREAAIRGWTAAREARLRDAENPALSDATRRAAQVAADVYLEVVQSYRTRLVDCAVAFPPVEASQ